MKQSVLPLFLAFLLVFGIVDDLFAACTADPADDVLAAANNTYLCKREEPTRLAQGSLALPARTFRTLSPGCWPGAARLPADVAPPLFLPAGARLLYLLASLQF